MLREGSPSVPARCAVDPITIAEEVEARGFCVVEALVDPSTIDHIKDEIERLDLDLTRSRGVRNLASRVEGVRALAASRSIRAVAESVLDPSARLVRSILFDKVAGANWSLRWHQDVTVAVAARLDTPGYSGWSVKDGIDSVHPPTAVLERMLTVRVHLDDCGAENGALMVIPGSHRHGKLDAARRRQLVERGPKRICATRAGGAVAMRPLLLHSSAEARAPSHRRVVHMDFAAGSLDGGLEWSQEA